jgi:hypothetical protein
MTFLYDHSINKTSSLGDISQQVRIAFGSEKLQLYDSFWRTRSKLSSQHQ